MDFPRPDVFGNYMLKDFGDIVMPADLTWWPIRPGWWVLLAVLVIAFSLYAYRRYRRWRRNAYRRAALAQLSAMTSLRDLNRIVKQAAVAAFPSDSTAMLWGNSWVEYLNHKTEKPCFVDGDEALFLCLLTKPETSWPGDIQYLRDRVRAWLQQHREESL
ncbi:MAG: DUF4381 domain-containing protein [Halioglobus sp.]